jgi:hypothetical protein
MDAVEQRAGGWLMLVVGLVALAGCGRSNQPGVQVDSPKSNAAQSGPSESEFAAQFLKALGNGTATPDALAPEFRKRIARPITEEDRRRGYSDLKTHAWLDRQSKVAYEVKQSNSLPSGACVRGTAASSGQPETFYLAIRKTADGGNWQVDWFHRTSVTTPEVPGPSPLPQGELAQNTARAFLETLLGGDLDLAEASLAQSFKAKLAESLRPSDKEIGYNPGILQAKLREWKSDSTTYSLQSGSDTTSFIGALISRDKKRPFTLRYGYDAQTGQCEVTDFEFE